MANLGFFLTTFLPQYKYSDRTDSFAVVLHLQSRKWKQSLSRVEQDFFSGAVKRRQCYFLEAPHHNGAIEHKGREG